MIWTLNMFKKIYSVDLCMRENKVSELKWPCSVCNWLSYFLLSVRKVAVVNRKRKSCGLGWSSHKWEEWLCNKVKNGCKLLMIDLHWSVLILSMCRRGPVRFKFQCLFELENVAVVNMTSADGMCISCMCCGLFFFSV